MVRGALLRARGSGADATVHIGVDFCRKALLALSARLKRADASAETVLTAEWRALAALAEISAGSPERIPLRDVVTVIELGSLRDSSVVMAATARRPTFRGELAAPEVTPHTPGAVRAMVACVMAALRAAAAASDRHAIAPLCRLAVATVAPTFLKESVDETAAAVVELITASLRICHDAARLATVAREADVPAALLRLALASAESRTLVDDRGIVAGLAECYALLCDPSDARASLRDVDDVIAFEWFARLSHNRARRALPRLAISL